MSQTFGNPLEIEKLNDEKVRKNHLSFTLLRHFWKLIKTMNPIWCFQLSRFFLSRRTELITENVKFSTQPQSSALHLIELFQLRVLK